MKTIFYGVAGEGNGHAIRAETIINALKSDHNIYIFSHGKGFAYLSKYFPVKRTLGFHMYYRNNKVSTFWTGVINALKFPFMCLASLRYIPAFVKYNPTYVISDFEPFLAYWAKIFGVPLVSIDNQHSITHTEVDRIKGEWLNELYSKLVVHTFLPLPNKTIITTFFPTSIKKDYRQSTTLVEPIIREEIIKAKKGTKRKKHILVYQTSQSYEKMFPILKKIKRNFIVYGFDKNKKEENLRFKKFSKTQYVKDLATADAVIINGGFTALSEALYLNKPIFSIPIKRQFEQVLNGHYINKKGYGVAVKHISEENFNKFLKNKETYRRNIKKITWDKNSKLFATLRRLRF